jgi:hypothetical protein
MRSLMTVDGGRASGEVETSYVLSLNEAKEKLA